MCTSLQLAHLRVLHVCSSYLVCPHFTQISMIDLSHFPTWPNIDIDIQDIGILLSLLLLTFISLLLVKALIFKWKVKFSSLDLDSWVRFWFIRHRVLDFLGWTHSLNWGSKRNIHYMDYLQFHQQGEGVSAFLGALQGCCLDIHSFPALSRYSVQMQTFPLLRHDSFLFFVVDVGCQVIPTTCSVPRKVLLIFIKLLCCHPSSWKSLCWLLYGDLYHWGTKFPIHDKADSLWAVSYWII